MLFRQGVLMSSTSSAYPQVVLRTFTSFRVVKSRVPAGKAIFCGGFDSRQLHKLVGRSECIFGLACF
jgi:hypothetical protein